MLCWFFRFMISSAADTGSAIGQWTRRHIARCASCREFLQICRTIDMRLRSDAAAWRQGSGQLFHPLGPSLAGMQPSSHISRIRVVFAAAACIAIATAAIFWFTTPTRPPQAPTTTMGSLTPAGPQWATKWTQLIKNPLATEAEHLTSDTESGIRFLVACLDVRPVGADVAPRPGGSASPPQ